MEPSQPINLKRVKVNEFQPQDDDPMEFEEDEPIPDDEGIT